MNCKKAVTSASSVLTHLCLRNSLYDKWVKTINDTEGGFDKFSKGYEKYGLNVKEDGSNDIVYREWAPNAETAALIGDFSASSTGVDMA